MRTFGHCRPVRNDKGWIISHKPSPVRAVTKDTLGTGYGTDSDKRLVVSLEAGDLIVIRPEKTTRTVSITVVDIYAHIIRCQSNLIALAKARARKVVKQTAREAARIKAADLRISRQAKEATR